jgi:hypothetical protein
VAGFNHIKTQYMHFYKLSNSSKYILLAILLFIGLSCRYYKPVLSKTGNAGETGNFISTNAVEKYFIIRQGANSYNLKDIVVDNSNLTLSGKLEPVDIDQLLYIKAERKKYQYRGSNGEKVLNEVHIYLKKEAALIDATKVLVLPLDQVEKIEVIEQDKARTTTSYILGGIGIGLGVAMVAGVIVALTKSSCPFVSVYDGEKIPGAGRTIWRRS